MIWCGWMSHGRLRLRKAEEGRNRVLCVRVRTLTTLTSILRYESSGSGLAGSGIGSFLTAGFGIWEKIKMRDAGCGIGIWDFRSLCTECPSTAIIVLSRGSLIGLRYYGIDLFTSIDLSISRTTPCLKCIINILKQRRTDRQTSKIK